MSQPVVTLVDLGAGNLSSVARALEAVGARVEQVDRPEPLATAERVVLPGQGAFRDSIERMRERGLDQAVLDVIRRGQPLLGICVGLQLLYDVGEEDGEHRGLGVLPGRVVRLKGGPGLKVPHMGWNPVARRRSNPVFDAIADGEPMYFVHSYVASPTNPDDPTIVLENEHGQRFPTAVATGNVVACQFHPEKSSAAGLALLRRFLEFSP